MCWSLHCGWPVPLISLWHLFFSSMNSLCLCVDHCIVDDHFLLFSLGHPFCSSKKRLTLCVDRCIVDDQFIWFPCGILSFLRRTVYVYVLIVVLWMTCSSYFLAASFLLIEEQSTFMCWSLYCGWPVPLISLRCPFFSSKNSLRLCVDRCIVDDQFILFPCGIFSFLRRTVYVYVFFVVLWMTSSSHFFAAFFLFFEEQSTFMCWRCIVDDQFLLFPCGILSSLRRTVYVYVLIVVLWITSSSYFLVAFFLFFEEQSRFMCWSLYCEWPVPLISLWNHFFSSKNSLRLCVDRCISDDQFLLFPFGIFSFLRRTVYVYVFIVVLWMTSSSYFLVRSFLFFEEQSTFMCWSLHCGWPVPLISLWHLFFSLINNLRLSSSSLYCGWPVPLISLWHPFFSSKNSLRLCVDSCIVDDQFLLFPCGIISFLRRTVYVYVLSVVLWMTSSSYFLAASFHFFEEESMFMCWSLHCGWPVPLISLWHLFFSSKNSLRLCVDHCIVNDQFLLFPCGILSFLLRIVYVYVLFVVLWMTSSSYFLLASFSFLRRTVYVYVLIVVLWMTSSSYFLAASFLFFEEQCTFICWSLYCGWPASSYFFAASFLFFEEQSTFMCWSLYCGWPVPLISLWHPFSSSKNSLRLCVDRCIVDDHFLLFPCGILSFLRRTVYVYVLIVVLWMTSSSYFLVESFTFLRRTVYVHMLIVVLWMTTSSYFFAASFLFFEEQSTFMSWLCIVDDQFLLFPCGILSSLRRTVYVYVLIVVLWMTSSS